MRLILILGFLTLLLFVPVSNADLLKPQQSLAEQKVGAMSARAYRQTFKPNESAEVKAYGSGSSSLLLYIFDPNGNCVAWDDNITEAQFCDELGVDWIANSDGRYSIEVRNVGLSPHAFTLAVR